MSLVTSLFQFSRDPRFAIIPAHIYTDYIPTTASPSPSSNFHGNSVPWLSVLGETTCFHLSDSGEETCFIHCRHLCNIHLAGVGDIRWQDLVVQTPLPRSFSFLAGNFNFVYPFDIPNTGVTRNDYLSSRSELQEALTDTLWRLPSHLPSEDIHDREG